jgi:hypothetical protein
MSEHNDPGMRVFYYLAVMLVFVLIWVAMPREVWPMLGALAAGLAMVLDIMILPADKRRGR